jgi:hypothetical protein
MNSIIVIKCYAINLGFRLSALGSAAKTLIPLSLLTSVSKTNLILHVIEKSGLAVAKSVNRASQAKEAEAFRQIHLFRSSMHLSLTLIKGLQKLHGKLVYPK